VNKLHLDKWTVNQDEQKKYIKRLAAQLVALRAKVGISQEDIARIIGISRQTYSGIENGRKDMTWSVYVALIFFFDSNDLTHEMIRSLNIYPVDMIVRFNDGRDTPYHTDNDNEILRMIHSLDKQGQHSIKTILLVEYARCNRLSGETVIKAFDGEDMSVDTFELGDLKTMEAIQNIRNRDK